MLRYASTHTITCVRSLVRAHQRLTGVFAGLALSLQRHIASRIAYGLESDTGLWQVVSRKSVFTDRTRELARRAAGDAGDFYGRSKPYIHAFAHEHCKSSAFMCGSVVTGDLL